MDFKHELIVHLHDHTTLVSSMPKFVINIHHGKLDDISTCSLYRHIDGFSLRCLSHHRIGVAESWEPTFTTKIRLHISIFSSLLEKRTIVLPYFWIGRIKSIDVLFSLCWTDRHHLAQSKSRDAINHTKVDTLCLCTMSRRDDFLIWEDRTRCTLMDIHPRSKDLQESLVFCQTRKDAKLNL